MIVAERPPRGAADLSGGRRAAEDRSGDGGSVASSGVAGRARHDGHHQRIVGPLGPGAATEAVLRVGAGRAVGRVAAGRAPSFAELGFREGVIGKFEGP